MSHSLSLLISASKCTIAPLQDWNKVLSFISRTAVTACFSSWWPWWGWWCWCRWCGRSRPGRMLMTSWQGLVIAKWCHVLWFRATVCHTCDMSHVTSYIVTCLGVWFGIGWLFWIIVLFPRNIKTARPVPQLCDNQGTHCCQPLTSSWVLGVQNMAIFLNKVIANCCPNCLHSLFIVGTWSEHKWASLMLSLESGYSDTDHQPG